MLTFLWGLRIYMNEKNRKNKVLICPVCKASTSKSLKLPEVTIYRCSSCSHCFSDYSSIVIKEKYGRNYFFKTHRNWFENPNYRLFAMLKKAIVNNQTKKVLDVGCGNGAFLKYLADTTNELSLQGIDLSDAAIEDASITFLKGDFLTYKFNEKFDVVVSLAVIEHLNDVSSFVQRIHNLLNKDGMACVMTVNESGILYQLANLLRKVGFPSVFIRLYDKHHLNHFSKKSLIRLLTSNTMFTVIDVIDHNAPLKSIDIPTNNYILRCFLKLGIATVFLIGNFFNRSYLQTVLISKID